MSYNPLSIQHMCVQILGRALPAGTLLGVVGRYLIQLQMGFIQLDHSTCCKNVQRFCRDVALAGQTLKITVWDFFSAPYFPWLFVDPREYITNLAIAACDEPHLFCIIM